jgi:glycosyltransferase involved in cell wall biosynthesis
MHAETKPSFAFLVVTYNHQDYILEHLESIKYLVQTHGAVWDIDLIVNDDASRDQTRTLVDRWLAVHAPMFRHVKTLYNAKNLGTCTSVNNMLTHMVADHCKLTAGDDVYSFENIFELTQSKPDTAMVSGRVLYLLGDQLGVDRVANTLATATQVIYENESLLHRFKHLSYNNAPNLLYVKECLLNPKVRSYLQSFDVVEDWPLQLAIAREYPMRRMALLDHVLVYYRRTAGSTYIVANQRFIKDKIKIYDDLIHHESQWLERLRLKSRRFCFKSQNPWINKIANIDFYLFMLACLGRLNSIIKSRRNLASDLSRHQNHYSYIKNQALIFLGDPSLH